MQHDLLTRHARGLAFALFTLLAPARAFASEAVTLSFVPEVNGAPFSCRARYANVGTDRAPWQPSDFRMYVSEVALIDAQGQRLPVKLVADGSWQNPEVALLDFEDQTGSCKNGTKETNFQVHGTVEHAVSDAVGLAFEIAVPFAHNHADATAAMPPLDQAGMFWSWQGGYKFLSIDGRVNDKSGHAVHIGSTGCEMERPNRVKACSRPNHIPVLLPAFRPQHDRVVVDIGHLLRASFVQQSATPHANGCMSEPDNLACKEVFERAGLSGRAQSFVTSRQAAKQSH